MGERFEDFFERKERAVRVALCAGLGFDAGREAAADAFAYAWEHWSRVGAMENPAGYVYRVGQRLGRRRVGRRPPPRLFERQESSEPWVEPGLRDALDELSEQQRTAVALAIVAELTHRETAEMMGVSMSSVQTHLERGMSKLRSSLGVPS